MKQKIWTGIFTSFSEAKQKSNPFDSKRWIDSQKDELSEILKHSKHKDKIKTVSKYVLKAFSETILLHQKSIHILDFGGGLGITYFSDFGEFLESNKIKYTVIERPEICQEGTMLCKSHPNICFKEKIPAEGTFDIVFCGSSFHYCDKWKDTIKSFVRLSPKLLIFSDLPVGKNPTFITLQKYYENSMPVRFFNQDMFENQLIKLNYKPIFTKNMPDKYGAALEHFDSPYRVDVFKELVFIRAEE